MSEELSTVLVCETDLWETPYTLFKEFDDEFHFEWDVCATAETTKVPGKFFSPKANGLKQDWHSVARTLWMNPPYSKGGKKDEWIRKAFEESLKGCTVVALLPAKTDTRSFHVFINNRPNVEIRFLKGRPKFLMNGKTQSTGRSPIMAVVFRPPQGVDNV